MKKILSLFILLISISSNSQTNVSCKDIKNGIFYSYPKSTADLSVTYRNGDVQKEINLTTGDTIYWKVKWDNKCRYTLEYKSSTQPKSKEDLKILNNYRIVITPTSITNDYYTFKVTFDRFSNLLIEEDTMWLKEKKIDPKNLLFKKIDTLNEAIQLHDTSKFALLYVYRPYNFLLCLAKYPIYFDNLILCAGKNNRGYLFKIFKEGNFKVDSRLFKDQAAVNLNVKFGHTYYVRSRIHWGITKRLYNFKLGMAIMNEQEGKADFEQVKHK